METLKKYSKDYNNTELQRNVAEILLSYDDPAQTLKEVLEHGCVSGIISELIYYNDTEKFYDDNYNDIESLRYDYEEETGTKLHPGNNLKNWFAWFAFEHVCFELEGHI